MVVNKGLDGCPPFFCRKKMRKISPIGNIVVALWLAVFASCNKTPGYLHEAALNFSTDTLTFDTVFTTVGSTTKYFTAINNRSQDIYLDKIYLAGGSASPFRLNIDGVVSTSVSDVVIPANDSIFIFVEVTVNPTNANSPMVVEDSVVFVAEGSQKSVQLVAWGQDVHLFENYVLQHDTVWDNDKPYLIYGYIYVDSGTVLTINQGCRIHLHHASSIYVQGKLIVNGTLDEPVTFQGDRLEAFYEDIPGQWDRIAFFQGSKGNVINYAVIKNSIIGIQTGETPDYNDFSEVSLNNVKIFNTNYAGIFSLGGHITAQNTIVANSGFYEMALLIGGNYNFLHCSVNNFWTYSHRTEASVLLSNNLVVDGVLYAGNMNVLFGNSIIYGDRDDELEVSVETSGQLTAKFNNCLIKTASYSPTDTIYFNPACLFNVNPGFVAPEDYDFHLKYGSYCINKGDNAYGYAVPVDYDGNNRTLDAAPDLGAFEYVEQ